MKISLNIECETLEDFQRAIAALTQTGASSKDYLTAVAHRAAAVAKALETETTEQERQPPASASAPVAPSAPVEVATPPSTESAAAPVEAKKPRGRAKKQAAAETPPTTPDSTVTDTPATKLTVLKGGVSVTRDDLMKTFASYVQRYGTNFGYTDVSKMLTDTFGPGVRKSSDVTDDNLAKAVAVVSQAIEANPFQRKRADVN